MISALANHYLENSSLIVDLLSLSLSLSLYIYIYILKKRLIIIHSLIARLIVEEGFFFFFCVCVWGDNLIVEGMRFESYMSLLEMLGDANQLRKKVLCSIEPYYFRILRLRNWCVYL